MVVETKLENGRQDKCREPEYGLSDPGRSSSKTNQDYRLSTLRWTSPAYYPRVQCTHSSWATLSNRSYAICLFQRGAESPIVLHLSQGCVSFHR